MRRLIANHLGNAAAAGLLLVYLSSCSSNPGGGSQVQKTIGGVALKITSNAFEENSAIPKKYTCDGDNVSPPLQWSGLSSGVQSLALVCDDPDAPGKTWVHWVVYDLPPSTTGLPENIKSATLPKDAKQGLNDFKQIGYGGPCPPSGTHRYFFHVYALDKKTSLNEGATREQLEKAMASHILAQGVLMGTYKR